MKKIATIAWVLLGFVVLIIVIAPKNESTGNDGGKKSASPATPLEKVKASTDVIEVLEPTPGVVTVRYSPKAIWDGSGWVRSFFITAQKVVQILDEGRAVQPINTVHFFAELPTTDNLGREGKAVGMEVSYQLDAFVGAQWQNISHWNMAELPSSIEFRRLGLESAADFCKDEDNAKYARGFCVRVLAKLVSGRG